METIDKIRQAERDASERLMKAQEDSARLIEEKKNGLRGTAQSRLRENGRGGLSKVKGCRRENPGC